MLGLSITLNDQVMHCFAGNLLMALKLSLAEGPGRKPTVLVDDVNEAVSAICDKGLGTRRSKVGF